MNRTYITAEFLVANDIIIGEREGLCEVFNVLKDDIARTTTAVTEFGSIVYSYDYIVNVVN